MKTDIYAIVTQEILDILSQGVGQWEHYLTNASKSAMPVNMVSGKAYTGVNVLSLMFRAAKNGWACNQWATFNQIKAAGGSVVAGSKGTPVLFFRPIERENAQTGDTEQVGVMARYYTVFNLAQTTLDWATPAAPVMTTDVTLDAKALFPGVKIHEAATNCAFYSPAMDSVTMPLRSDFKSNAHYFSTLAHEVAHWTGHESRLNRKFGAKATSAYATEELVAELATCFVAAVTGTEFHSQQNSAAYLAGWLAAARQESKYLVQVASAAQKACDLVVANLNTQAMSGALAG